MKKIIGILVCLVINMFLFPSSGQAATAQYTTANGSYNLSTDKDSAIANNSDKIIITGQLNQNWPSCASKTIGDTSVMDLSVSVSGSSNNLTRVSRTVYMAGFTVCDYIVKYELKSSTAESKRIVLREMGEGKSGWSDLPVAINITFNSGQPSVSSTPKKSSTPTTKLSAPTITTLNNIAPNSSSPMTIQSGQPIVLSGKTTPNLTVRLFIYSDPTQADVKADAKGDWTYTITQALAPGIHRVEAQTIDASGNASDKVELAQFTVGEATTPTTTQNSLWIYIGGGALVILLVVLVVYLYLRRRKNNLPKVS